MDDPETGYAFPAETERLAGEAEAVFQEELTNANLPLECVGMGRQYLHLLKAFVNGHDPEGSIDALSREAHQTIYMTSLPPRGYAQVRELEPPAREAFMRGMHTRLKALMQKSFSPARE